MESLTVFKAKAPLRNLSNGNTSSTLFHIGAEGTRNIGRSHSNTHPRYLQEGGGRIMCEPQTHLTRVLYRNDRTSKPLTFLLENIVNLIIILCFDLFSFQTYFSPPR